MKGAGLVDLSEKVIHWNPGIEEGLLKWTVLFSPSVIVTCMKLEHNPDTSNPFKTKSLVTSTIEHNPDTTNPFKTKSLRYISYTCGYTDGTAAAWNAFKQWHNGNGADRLAQLVERWTTVREVSGSSPRLDQHDGSYNNWGECAAFAMTCANG